MKMNLLFFSLALLFALGCKQKELSKAEREEKAKQESLEKATKLAAPMIADQEGDLNNLLATASDPNTDGSHRGLAINKIRQKFVEYLTEISVENMNSTDMQQRILLQKQLIEKKCVAEAAQVVYKEALQKEYEDAEDLKNATLKK